MLNMFVFMPLLFFTSSVDTLPYRLPSQKFSLQSEAGLKLLDQAIVTDPSKHLLVRRRERRAQYGNNWSQGYDSQYGLDNLSELHIQYTGCRSFFTTRTNQQQNQQQQQQQQQEQEQQEQQDEEQYEDQDDVENDQNQVEDVQKAQKYGAQLSHLVFFTICENDGCSDCSGEYATDMNVFLDSYTEMQLNEQQYQCEYVRERCFCSYNNGNNYYYQNAYESCLSDCFSNAGLSGCMQEYYGGNQFRLQEYLECKYALGNGGDDNQNSDNYFVGPYCSENQYIYLGAFYDDQCSDQAYPTELEQYNYGDGFPYFYDPILSGGECVSCSHVSAAEEGGDDAEANDQKEDANEADDQNENQDDQNQNDQAQENNGVKEICERATDDALKCDSDRGYGSGCFFFETTLPCIDNDRRCDDDGTGLRYSFPRNEKSMAQRYYEMRLRFLRNRNAMIVTSAIAAISLLLLVFHCFLFRPCSPEEQKRREPLLKRYSNAKTYPL